MPRFYCSTPLAAGLTLDLPDTVAHHLHVLRLQPGDALTLFNGDGNDYHAALASIDKRRASVVVERCQARATETPYALTLVQALPEGAKMDWIIEKAVELGVAAVQPVSAQRCVVRLSEERAAKKLAHWEAIVIAASEQCGRNHLASVGAPVEVTRWLARPQPAQPVQRLLLSPRGALSLAAWAREQPPQALHLLVGPEGGYSPQEEDAAIAAGALAVSMGPRILRTETAGLAAAVALAALWGGF